ncbi:MAG: type IX secretion system PorP/SprF family membrane protein [Saprospiraceae bacterium]|jgi:type IX secretion system PorP/SprF family membrane protein
MIWSSICSQQQNQYTQFALNKYVFNPAYAGLDFSVSANLMYRNQWDGIDGNPRDINLNAHLPFYLWSGAIGGIIEKQSFGALSQTSLSGSYNYVASLQTGLLSFGGRVGISQLSVDGSRIITPEGDYSGIFSHNDPILLENSDLGLGLKWDAGVFFYNKKIELGVAISHFPQNFITLERTSYHQTTHVNSFFQYNFKIFENIDLLQSILLKTDFDQIQSDVSSIFRINGNIFGGINMRGYNSRSLDAMAIIAGMKLGDHYTISYSYDLGVSGLRRAHEGTHEILINYNLRKVLGSGELPKIIYNPRYL